MEDGERTGELLALEQHRRERALTHLLHHGRLRHDGDAMVDLDCAFHRLDVVELHHRRDLEFVIAENLVDGLARRDVRVEADELVSRQCLHLYVTTLRQRVIRMRNDHEPVIPERNHVNLAGLLRERH